MPFYWSEDSSAWLQNIVSMASWMEVVGQERDNHIKEDEAIVTNSHNSALYLATAYGP